MLAELLQSTNLFHLLHRIDISLAEQQQNAGCPFCGGPLHHSSYQRNPRGGPELPEDLLQALKLMLWQREVSPQNPASINSFYGSTVIF